MNQLPPTPISLPRPTLPPAPPPTSSTSTLSRGLDVFTDPFADPLTIALTTLRAASQQAHMMADLLNSFLRGSSFPGIYTGMLKRLRAAAVSLRGLITHPSLRCLAYTSAGTPGPILRLVGVVIATIDADALLWEMEHAHARAMRRYVRKLEGWIEEAVERHVVPHN